MVRLLLLVTFAMCSGLFATLQAQDSLSTPRFKFEMGLSMGLRYGFLNTNESPSDTALSTIEGLSVNGSPGFSVGFSFLVSNETKDSFRSELNLAYNPTNISVKRFGKDEKKMYIHSLVAELPLYYQRHIQTKFGASSNKHMSGFVGVVPQISIPDLDIPPFPNQIFNVQAAVGGSYAIVKAKKNNISKTFINLEFRAGLINLKKETSDIESQWFNKFFRNEVVLTLHFL